MSEEQMFEDATDEDIFSAVQKARTDQENMEINGGDDNQDNLADDPKPIHKEAPLAVSTLPKYLADVDGAFAQKLEMGLATFGCETQLERSKTLVSTSIILALWASLVPWYSYCSRTKPKLEA
jgi:hypothetical protein